MDVWINPETNPQNSKYYYTYAPLYVEDLLYLSLYLKPAPMSPYYAHIGVVVLQSPNRGKGDTII